MGNEPRAQGARSIAAGRGADRDGARPRLPVRGARSPDWRFVAAARGGWRLRGRAPGARCAERNAVRRARRRAGPSRRGARRREARKGCAAGRRRRRRHGEDTPRSRVRSARVARRRSGVERHLHRGRPHRAVLALGAGTARCDQGARPAARGSGAHRRARFIRAGRPISDRGDAILADGEDLRVPRSVSERSGAGHRHRRPALGRRLIDRAAHAAIAATLSRAGAGRGADRRRRIARRRHAAHGIANRSERGARAAFALARRRPEVRARRPRPGALAELGRVRARAFWRQPTLPVRVPARARQW